MKEVILPVLLEMARLIAAPVYLSWVLCFYRRLHADAFLVLLVFLITALVFSSFPVSLLMQAVNEGNGLHAYKALAIYAALWAVGRYLEYRWKDEE